MRLARAIPMLAALAIGAGCGGQPPEPDPTKGSGLEYVPRPPAPPKAAVYDSPEALAKAFQNTLAQNNAEAMLMLSLIGHGTNAWLEFSQATLQAHRRQAQTELNTLAAKPREQRSDAEQARFFSLKVQLEALEKSHAENFNNLHIRLPADRKRFKEQEYFALQLTLKDNGMHQDLMQLDRVDTSLITTNFLNAKLHGGPVELHYRQQGEPLRGTILFNCAKLKGLGWVIVDPPRIKANREFGPQTSGPGGQPEPFPAPPKNE
tara:strand:+ start:942 stop:1730 length:789 start_codon:yes stop_codon:yes gene_type:complete